MSTHRPQPPILVEVAPDALSAVTFALQRTIDDLEARAIVAAAHDPDLGPSSAAEYRADIDRLGGLLSQLGHTAARPDPERAAVVWFDGTYTIADGRPVVMTSKVALDRLVEHDCHAVAGCAKRRRDPWGERSSRRSTAASARALAVSSRSGRIVSWLALEFGVALSGCGRGSGTSSNYTVPLGHCGSRIAAALQALSHCRGSL